MLTLDDGQRLGVDTATEASVAPRWWHLVGISEVYFGGIGGEGGRGWG